VRVLGPEKRAKFKKDLDLQEGQKILKKETIIKQERQLGIEAI
jgi:hypothetical protein